MRLMATDSKEDVKIDSALIIGGLIVVLVILLGVYLLTPNEVLGKNEPAGNTTANVSTNMTSNISANITPNITTNASANATPPAKCTDSDFGKNILEAGTTSLDPAVEMDSCADQNTVTEFYCSNGAIMDEDIACPADFECDGGACQPKPGVILVCDDTDGGVSRIKKGTATVSDGKSTVGSETDYCVDGNNLQEFFCDNEMIDSIEIACPGSEYCLDGECVLAMQPLVCNESDSGKDYTSAGFVSDGINKFSDSCSGTELTEFYCSGTDVLNITVDCIGLGQICANGACEDECKDSDGGLDSENKGSATKGSESETDSCIGSSQINEYFCSSSNEIKNQTLSCPLGYWCIYGSGECTKKPACVDNDGGNVTLIASSATSATTTKYDSCNGTDYVLEAYCDDNEDAVYANIYCGSGSTCSAGSCLLLAMALCSDPDGTYDTGTKSTVTDSVGSYTDTCTPGGWVRDYFCVNSTHASYYDIQCPPGQLCSNGVCK